MNIFKKALTIGSGKLATELNAQIDSINSQEEAVSKLTDTEIKESKGSASKPVASTKSEKQEVISEGHELRDRFKKLAGIL